MKGELRQMMAQGSGVIVNCSSIGGLKGSRGRSAYSASKHAVIGLTRSAALDYAAMGIRINAVCPGVVNTPMAAFVTKNYDPEIVKRMVAQEPIGRFGEPEGNRRRQRYRRGLRPAVIRRRCLDRRRRCAERRTRQRRVRIREQRKDVLCRR
jgi:NAD(P)-dependent dehydrogenase (short-subunit alcohol dehydrogenase family)